MSITLGTANGNLKVKRGSFLPMELDQGSLPVPPHPAMLLERERERERHRKETELRVQEKDSAEGLQL